jgi:cation transport ATPase
MTSKNYLCRICYDESSHREEFIVPCDCDGTQKYVHIECLNSWFRSSNTANANYERCNVCHFKYLRTKSNAEKKIENLASQEVYAYTVYLTLIFILLGAFVYSFPGFGIFVFMIFYWVFIMAILIYEYPTYIFGIVAVLYFIGIYNIEKKKTKMRGPITLMVIFLYILSLIFLYNTTKELIYKSFLGKMRLESKCSMYDRDLGRYVDELL